MADWLGLLLIESLRSKNVVLMITVRIRAREHCSCGPLIFSPLAPRNIVVASGRAPFSRHQEGLTNDLRLSGVVEWHGCDEEIAVGYTKASRYPTAGFCASFSRDRRRKGHSPPTLSRKTLPSQHYLLIMC